MSTTSLRVALVTAPPDATSHPTAAWREALARALAARTELVRFGPTDIARLDPRAHQRILWVLEDDPAAAFALPRLRTLGGVVALRRWHNPALVAGASTVLQRGGLRSDWFVLRHGGWDEARAWRTARRAGTPAPALALHLPLVRFGDGYIVPDKALERRVIEDRNAATPVAIDAFGDTEADASTDAERWVSILELMPAHRTGRQSLIKTAIEGADAARAARNEPK